MAEVFFLTRGHHDHVDKFVRSMRNLWFPVKFKKKLKDENGKEVEVEQTSTMDGQLRPYRLYGYVLPEEFVEPLCNSLGIPTEETVFDQKPNSPGTSFVTGKGIKAHLWAFRKLLGAMKLPKHDPEKGVLSQPIYKTNVNVLGIGWRKDNIGKDSSGEHEMW